MSRTRCILGRGVCSYSIAVVIKAQSPLLSVVTTSTASNRSIYMPQARPYREPLGDENCSSAMMVNVFGHRCGGQRMLRGEQLFRTQKVLNLTTVANGHGTIVKARVLSQDWRSNAPGGAYATCIRFERLSDEETRYAGEIFRKLDAWAQLERLRQSGVNVLEQPGKGAALAEQLIKALDGTTLDMMPRVVTATCTCNDLCNDVQWCKHIAALGFQLVHFCEVDPFYPFSLRQLDLKGLHKMRPRKRARHQLPDSRDEVIELSDSEDAGSSAHQDSGSSADHAGSNRKHPIECD